MQTQPERFHIAQSLVQPGYGPVSDDIKQSGVVIAWYWMSWRRLCPECIQALAHPVLLDSNDLEMSVYKAPHPSSFALSLNSL